MTRIDPECFPEARHSDALVCAGCFDDPDLKAIIQRYSENVEEQAACTFCSSCDEPVAYLDDVADFISRRLATFYGKAVNQLVYESQEGGYQGWHVDTWDLLYGTVGLGLPNDRDSRLARALVNRIGDDVWCEYDWLALEYDESLQGSWSQFCSIVKHRRRFFFHELGEHSSHPDERSMRQFLTELCNLIGHLQFIVTRPAGYALYRARGSTPGHAYVTPSQLGPPPEEYANMSNRMNPPGIPMFYGAEQEDLACAEARASLLSVGRFVTERESRILDLAQLPPVPGFFSEASREEKLGLQFLHQFAQAISLPVSGDDRTHVEYIPTQIFTEFLRDFDFGGDKIDGLRYSSATGLAGANVVLFATQRNVFDAVTDGEELYCCDPWLRLVETKERDITPST